MKKLLWAAAVTLAFSSGASAQDAAGLWQTEPGDTGGFLHVAVAPCGAKICGTIQTAFGADRKPIANYEHQGKPIIWDMDGNAADGWSGGRIWAPDRDKTYRSKMELSGDRLIVSGCVAGGLICRSQNWVRVR